MNYKQKKKCALSRMLSIHNSMNFFIYDFILPSLHVIEIFEVYVFQDCSPNYAFCQLKLQGCLSYHVES